MWEASKAGVKDKMDVWSWLWTELRWNVAKDCNNEAGGPRSHETNGAVCKETRIWLDASCPECNCWNGVVKPVCVVPVP